MENKPKDPLIGARSVTEGKNSKGGDRIQLTIGGESERDQANLRSLVETLTAHLESPRGVKLDIHISDKEYDGRKFRSAFMFVKPVGDPPGRAGGPKTYVPKAAATPTSNASTTAAAARATLKSAQVKD